MPKLFYMEFNVGDWLKDPAVSLLKPSTRGVWIDMICAMHELDQCGQLSGTVNDLSRICRCTPNEMRVALDDLKLRNAADVTERDNNVTLQNRRMRRKWTGRNSSKLRKQRQRSRERGDDVTPDVTPKSQVSLSIPIPKESPQPPSGETPQPEFFDLMPARLRDSPAFLVAWGDWLSHRRERKPVVKSTAAKLQLAKLEKLGPARAVVAIRHSVANGWQGIFEPKDGGPPSKSPSSVGGSEDGYPAGFERRGPTEEELRIATGINGNGGEHEH